MFDHLIRQNGIDGPRLERKWTIQVGSDESPACRWLTTFMQPGRRDIYTYDVPVLTSPMIKKMPSSAAKFDE